MAFSSQSTLGDLLDNAGTKAVLAQYLPEMINNPMISQGRGMTLASLAQFVPQLSPDLIAKIDADLAKVS